MLLVEDDRATANATAGVLDAPGYSVEWAQNGSEPLETLAKRPFDAVMLDLVMPQVDGFSVLDHFRAEGVPLRKVIVITGMPDRYLESLDANALGGILHKPFDVQRLRLLLTHRVPESETPFEPHEKYPRREVLRPLHREFTSA